MTEIRIIGAGKMGCALAMQLKKHSLSFYDRHPELAKAAAKACHGTAVDSPFHGVNKKTIVILAIKPQDFKAFSHEAKAMPPCHCIVSILSGIEVATLQAAFPSTLILRMMPNMAVRTGKGVIVLALTDQIAPLKNEMTQLFSPLGLVQWMPESLFHAATSLIGSGPGFFFAMVEAMIEAGVAMGFSSQEAYPLVKQMIEGSLSLLEESKNHPAELKWQITSPGGTTIQGLRTFEEKGVHSGILETFLAAYQRSKELH